ncbi:MAG: class I SAM-dependent methyltransferase [Deltaproteobacteria bacterium]|nr:class I SAM-dependent methyltransferase [Nannocystaceae bacterium]
MRPELATPTPSRSLRGDARVVPTAPDSEAAAAALVELGQALVEDGYEFVTVTPATHARALHRRGELATDLRDVFGWNRPFDPDLLPTPILTALRAAGCCRVDGTRLRSAVRFSSFESRLFVHSAYPTLERDAVFFGPDSYRFASAVLRHAPHSERIVDVGCGAGVGGIVLSSRGRQLVLADINERALFYSRVNARLAGIEPEIVHSDVLAGVGGDIDLVIANPPYLIDGPGRLYRDGGGEFGEALAVRIVQDALARLSPGGSLLLYTGSAIVDGCDAFLRAVSPIIARAHASADYEELDPDVFGEELDDPKYIDVERIAAVLLRVTLE